MIDLQSLHDMMQNTIAHLQDATEKGDQPKRERMHNYLTRLNNIAEEQTQRMSQQVEKLPGTDNGGPTGLMPGAGAQGPTGPEGDTAPAKPINLPVGKMTSDELRLSPALPPEKQEQPQIPDFARLAAVAGGGQYVPALPTETTNKLATSAIQAAGKLVPTDVLYQTPLAPAMLGWKALSTGAAQPLMEAVTENKPILPALQASLGKLTPAEQEKAAGSVENTNKQGPGGPPNLPTGTPPTPSTPQTEDYNQLEAGFTDRGKEGFATAAEMASHLENSAKNRGDDEEAARINKYRSILEKKPQLFTFENLLSFLFAGAPRTLANYNSQVHQWKQQLGQEVNTYEHYNKLGQYKALGSAAQQGHNQVEQAKLIFNQMDAQGKAEAAPYNRELDLLRSQEEGVHRDITLKDREARLQAIQSRESQLLQKIAEVDARVNARKQQFMPKQ